VSTYLNVQTLASRYAWSGGRASGWAKSGERHKVAVMMTIQTNEGLEHSA
jgi:hypothetical protein